MEAQRTDCPQCAGPLERTGPLQGLCQRCLLGGVHHPTLTEEPAPPPPGHTTLSAELPQLDIVSVLGRGGMGIVYKARQRRLDRMVALKVLAPELNEQADFAERFLREARVLARLDHPNVVGVYDFGESGGLYYLVLEYVEGMSLRDLIDADTKTTPEEALALVPQICEGLTYAHEQGVVHRDIKPENILVDRHGTVKLADFGLAKVVHSDSERSALTRRSQIMGTPQYMAPEQLKGTRDVDHRADIFSLGVVIYEMLTGELPVGRFEPPSHRMRVDVRLDEVVLRALESEPDKRYQRANDVRTDLEGLEGWTSENVPALAGPATGTKRSTSTVEGAPQAPLEPGLDFPAFLQRIPLNPWYVMDFSVLFGILWLVFLSLEDLGRLTELLAGAYPFCILAVIGRRTPCKETWHRRLVVGFGALTSVATVLLLSNPHFDSVKNTFLKSIAAVLVVLAHCAFDRFARRRDEWGSLIVCGVLLLIGTILHTSLYEFNRPREALAFASGFLSVMTLGSSLILAAEYFAPPAPKAVPLQLGRVLAIGLPGAAIYFHPIYL